MKVTKHFSVEEFMCRDGTPYPDAWVEGRLVPLCQSLEVLRALFKSPITILSGYRTDAYNARIGGARNSQHLKGRAADIKVKGVDPAQVAAAIEAAIARGDMLPGGLGRYPTFCHYDIRGVNARWTGRRVTS